MKCHGELRVEDATADVVRLHQQSGCCRPSDGIYSLVFKSGVGLFWTQIPTHFLSLFPFPSSRYAHRDAVGADHHLRDQR